ncbi:MAG: bifunctional serine/threonine-protein kinase/formylglycine-generating enzyme family protein [Pirellulales bacterium]
MSSAEIDTLLAGFRTGEKHRDGEQFARLLVRQKRLTAYQVQQIYAGKGKGLILGNYIVLDKLGQGGMGIVLKARHKLMDRIVALKMLPPAVTKSPEALRRFQREIKVAARLEHPNIVSAHDADEAHGTNFLVMQYVEGTDLARWVSVNGPLPVEEALACIVQASRGLEYAHRRGVVHRDIKPSNLLLDGGGTVKILDMGLARLKSAAPQQDQLTLTGQILGTVDFMAPEQAMDTRQADARADIYSLGVTLWYLLTGRALYEGDTAVIKLMSHQQQAIPSLREACPAASRALDAVFTRMVAKTPAERYQTMTEVIADLDRCRTGDASLPSVAAPPAEDARLHDFLRGMESTPKPAVATTVPKTVEPAPASEPTVTWQSPRVDTDAAIEHPLFGRALRRRVRQRGFRSACWQKLRILPRRSAAVLAASAGAFVLLAAIVFFLQTKDGAIRVEMNNPEIVRGEQSLGEGELAALWHGWPADAPQPAIAPFDAAQARQHQREWANYLKLPVEYENSIGMHFVLIPPGEFLMGSTPEEIEAAVAFAGKHGHWKEGIRSEAPQHKVILTQPIYLGVHEVTQAQYEQVLGQNPSYFAPMGAGEDAVAGMDTTSHPVEQVSWNDAAEFCAKLNVKEQLKPFYFYSGQTVAVFEGPGYRLPTEAEWEFACRAGTTTKYWTGNSEQSLVQAGWMGSNSGARPHPVGELNRNPLGLFDIHGNVWEWVQDWWGASSYRQFVEKPAINPSGPSSAGSQRVLRGGNCIDTASHCRASNRHAHYPSDRNLNIGFRAALVVGGSRVGR